MLLIPTPTRLLLKKFTGASWSLRTKVHDLRNSIKVAKGSGTQERNGLFQSCGVHDRLLRLAYSFRLHSTAHLPRPRLAPRTQEFGVCTERLARGSSRAAILWRQSCDTLYQLHNRSATFPHRVGVILSTF